MPTLAIKLLPMHLIDEPDVAMRSEMDDDGIRELAASIAAIGLNNPISVMQHGGRYRIEAGHRRFVACKFLGRDEIEARDYTGSGIPAQAIKGHENLMRRDPSDADVAKWLNDLQIAYHYTLDQLMGITGKSEDWLAKRLRLFNGNHEVFKALEDGKINLGQASLLNRFPEKWLPRYLDAVINSTPPVRVIEQWLQEAKSYDLTPDTQQQPAPGTTPGPTPAVVSVEACELCNGQHSPWDMHYIKVHKQCSRDVIRALRAGDQPGGQP